MTQAEQQLRRKEDANTRPKKTEHSLDKEDVQ